MKHSKSKSSERKKGTEERKETLRKYCDADKLFRQAREKFPLKKYVGDDDILDALVCAVTAFKGKDGLSRLGDGKSDSAGHPMQIVYYKSQSPITLTST